MMGRTQSERTPAHVVVFIALASITWAVGMWATVAISPKPWGVGPRRGTWMARYEALRPLVSGASRVDYLMDFPPRSADRAQRRERDRGQRFRAQYALAPIPVHRASSLDAVCRQASKEEEYFLIWDASFYSTLEQVLGRLEPIARQRGTVLEVHRADQRLALVVMRSE